MKFQSKNESKPRIGFTLVELLVVIAIIGMLVALLLPAVQSARETARRMHCQNNLKQMGIALQGYHDQYEHFPYSVSDIEGGTSIFRPDSQGYGWGVALLPFLELQNIYDQINPDWKAGAFLIAHGTTGKIIEVGATELSVFRCPSSLLPSHVPPGWANKTMPEHMVGYATSDYRASAGADGTSGLATGMFTTHLEMRAIRNREWLRVKDVTDGMSNTLAFGESAYVPLDEDISKWPAWIGGLNEDESAHFETKDFMRINCGVNGKSMESFLEFTLGDACAFSWHDGGAYFCFGDGSVHFIDEQIDFKVYQYLGDIDDGQVANLASF